jgi:hypothetical protein
MSDPCPFCGHQPIWFGEIVVACRCNVHDLEGVVVIEAIQEAIQDFPTHNAKTT